MGKGGLLRQWLDKGNNELRSAEYLATMHNPTPDEVICYLCQQAAEKYLKGFLFLNDIEPPKTHDLNELLSMCAEKNGDFSELSARMSVLKTHAIMPRYPNELAITGENMKMAIRYSKDMQEFVLGVISGMQDKALSDACDSETVANGRSYSLSIDMTNFTFDRNEVNER